MSERPGSDARHPEPEDSDVLFPELLSPPPAPTPAPGSVPATAPSAPGPVFVSYAQAPNATLNGEPGDKQAWKEQVARLVIALRHFGIEADADLFHGSDSGIEWTRWGPEQIRASARTVIAINAAWSERFRAQNDPTEGAGAVAEADELLGIFSRNQEEFRRRVVIVLLPGHTERDIPDRLLGVQRVAVPSFDLTGMTPLLRLLTGSQEYPLPPVGVLPPLPPRLLGQVHTASATLSATSTLSATGLSTTSGSAALTGDTQTLPSADSEVSTRDGDQRDQDAQVLPSTAEQRSSAQALLSAVRSSETVGGTSFSDRLVEELVRLVAQLSARTVEPVLPASTATRAPANVSRPDQLIEQVRAHLLGQMQQTASRLDMINRCWLMLALTPITPSGPASYRLPSTGARNRAERLVREVVETRSLPLTLTGFDSAVRAPRRVDFAGHPTPGPATDEFSTSWRLELGDGGEGAAAFALASEVQTQGGTIAAQGQPGEVRLDAELTLPVRRDRFELQLLMALELLGAHARAASEEAHRLVEMDPFPTHMPLAVGVRAQLFLPNEIRLARHHHTRVVGIQVVDEHRDGEGRATGEMLASGSRAVSLGSPAPASEVQLISNDRLGEPADLVQVAQQLAVQLLEHFGLEDTLVLTASGELDELAAGEADQQAVWQHARALGLLHVDGDETSPAQRRQRYEALREQARAVLHREAGRRGTQ